MAALDHIPARIKYYLLDYKDMMFDFFYKRYHKEALKDLTKEELADFLKYVSEADYKRILNSNEVNKDVNRSSNDGRM